MCRIARLFLLQRLKGSMSGDGASFVAVACFLPGQAKDLSAPLYSFVYTLPNYSVYLIIIIIIIFINCNWVISQWQWLFYMYTNMKKSN